MKKAPTPFRNEADAPDQRRQYTNPLQIALELTRDEADSLQELAVQLGLAVPVAARALLAMGLARAGREVRA